MVVIQEAMENGTLTPKLLAEFQKMAHEASIAGDYNAFRATGGQYDSGYQDFLEEEGTRWPL